MTEVPAYVTRAAEQHGLGPLVVGRKGSNPVTWFIGFGALAVGGGALLYAAMWWLPQVLDEGSRSLGVILALAGIGVVFAAGIGVRSLIKGFTAHYVYQYGAIQTRNRRVSVARWEQLDEIQRTLAARALFQEIISVRFFDGRRWEVEAATRQKDLDQRLVSAFLDAAGRLGRPVTQPSRRYKDEGVIPPRWLIGVVLGAGLVVACVGNAVLKAVGLPSMWAVAGGCLFAALIAWLVGQAYRLVVVTSALFAVIAGLSVAMAVDDLVPSINRWVVAAVVFTAEVVVLVLFLRVNAVLMPRLGAVGRRLYALTHGWRYRGRQEVAVPSPATASRLLSVPSSATTTVGRAVVTVTINGQPVTVFDRVRRRPRGHDRPQTVWQVDLPAPAPFQAYPDGTWVDGSTLWYAEESVTRTGVSSRRIQDVAARLVGYVAAVASRP